MSNQIHALTDGGRWNWREVIEKYVAVFLTPKRDPFHKEELFWFELQKTFCGVKDRPVLQRGHCLFSTTALTSASPSSPQSLIFAFSGRSEDPNSLQGPKNYTFHLWNPSGLIAINFCVSPVPWLLLTPLHALPPVKCHLITADLKKKKKQPNPFSSLLKYALLWVSMPGWFQPILISIENVFVWIFKGT